MLSRFAVSCARSGLGVTRQSVNIVKNNGQPNSSLRAMVSRIQSTMAAEVGASMGAQAQVFFRENSSLSELTISNYFRMPPVWLAEQLVGGLLDAQACVLGLWCSVV